MPCPTPPGSLLGEHLTNENEYGVPKAGGAHDKRREQAGVSSLPREDGQASKAGWGLGATRRAAGEKRSRGTS